MRTNLLIFPLHSLLSFRQIFHPPISLIVGPASAHAMKTAPAKRRLLHAISCLSSTPPDPHCSLCSVANSPQRVILQRKLSLSLRPAFKSHLVTSPATGLFLAGIWRIFRRFWQKFAR